MVQRPACPPPTDVAAPPFTACRLRLAGSALRDLRDGEEAEQDQRLRAGVARYVFLAGRNQDGVAGPQRILAAVGFGAAFARHHVDAFLEALVEVPAARRVEIVPTSVDLESSETGVRVNRDPHTLVWIGLPENLAYLELIDPKTEKARRDHLADRLLEYCNLDTLALVRLARFLQQK